MLHTGDCVAKAGVSAAKTVAGDFGRFLENGKVVHALNDRLVNLLQVLVLLLLVQLLLMVVLTMRLRMLLLLLNLVGHGSALHLVNHGRGIQITRDVVRS